MADLPLSIFLNQCEYKKIFSQVDSELDLCLSASQDFQMPNLHGHRSFVSAVDLSQRFIETLEKRIKIFSCDLFRQYFFSQDFPC